MHITGTGKRKSHSDLDFKLAQSGQKPGYYYITIWCYSRFFHPVLYTAPHPYGGKCTFPLGLKGPFEKMTIEVPYSQEVRLAPSLQEHPCELHHPVDIERLGGILCYWKVVWHGQGTDSYGDICNLLPPCMCRTCCVYRRWTPTGHKSSWVLRAPRCFPSPLPAPSLNNPRTFIPLQHMVRVPVGSLLKNQATSTWQHFVYRQLK